jgi:hypothetical protein
MVDIMDDAPPVILSKSTGVGGESTGVGAESRNTQSQNTGVMGDGTSKGLNTNSEYNQSNQVKEWYAVGCSSVMHGETVPDTNLCISEPAAPDYSELIGAPDANGYNVGHTKTTPDATHGDTMGTIAEMDGEMPGVPGKTTGVAGTSNTMEYFLVIDPVESGCVQIGYSPTKGMTMNLFGNPKFLLQQFCEIILNIPGRPPSADAAPSQECVGNVTRYPDVKRGTRRESSDVADAVRQPVVTQIG